MTDPDSIEIDEDATYVRLYGYSESASSIPDPLAADESGEWKGHTNVTSDEDRRLSIDSVSRGRWGFPFVETADDELVDALEDEGHEPLTPSDFGALLEEAPEFTYLRTPSSKMATRAEREHRFVSIVDTDEIAEVENEGK